GGRGAARRRLRSVSSAVVGAPPPPAGGGARPPVIPVRDGDRPILWPAVAVDPRSRAPAVRERDDRAATLEIVPLLSIEHGEKFGVIEAIDLAADATGAVDQSGVAAEVEQAPANRPFAEERRSRAERAMERVAAHQGAVGEQERRGDDPCQGVST